MPTLALLFLLITPAHAANPFADDASGILAIERDIQDHLLRLNTLPIEGNQFDFLSVGQVQSAFDLSPKYRLPETEADKARVRVTEKELTFLHELESQIKLSENLLGSKLKSTDLFFDSFKESRIAGILVPERFDIYNGAVNSPQKPQTAELPDSKLGTATREVCFYDPSAPTDILSFYTGLHEKNISCMFEPDSARLIPGPTDALSEKIEVLSGTRPDPSFFKRDIDDAKLDFTHAPDLKAIIMGYLEFKNDFSGQMMAQAIKFHAAKGTKVLIIVPGLPLFNFEHGPDEKLLTELKNFSPNIKIQEYRYTPKRPDATDALGFFNKTYHAKALVALARSRTSGASAVIVGGRNIKDTFYFRTPPELPKDRDFIQFGTKSEPFAFFSDLEVSIHSQELAEQVAGNLLAFFNRDMDGPRIVRMTEHLPVLDLGEEAQAALNEKLRSKTTVRFFFSVPYITNDAEPFKSQMEKLYVNLIGSAKHSIRITNPYVLGPRILGDALRKAAQRGVPVDFVTTLDFSGDNSPAVTGKLNAKFFNKLREDNQKDRKKDAKVALIRVFEWKTTPASIQHAKSMLIDGDLLYVGSANYDFRSTTQDIENGFLITGPITKIYKKRFEDFFKCHSKLITTPLEVGALADVEGDIAAAFELPPPPQAGAPRAAIVPPASVPARGEACHDPELP